MVLSVLTPAPAIEAAEPVSCPACSSASAFFPEHAARTNVSSKATPLRDLSDIAASDVGAWVTLHSWAAFITSRFAIPAPVIPAKAGIHSTVIPAKAGIHVSGLEHGSLLSLG